MVPVRHALKAVLETPISEKTVVAKPTSDQGSLADRPSAVVVTASGSRDMCHAAETEGVGLG